MKQSFYVYPMINEVVVLIKVVEKNEMLYFDKDLAENQDTVKVQTQKGICGTVLTVEFLPSGEHKNCDHVIIQILQILSTFQVNFFNVTMLT